MSDVKKNSQMTRILTFSLIGIVIGAALTYAVMSPSIAAGTTQASELQKQVNQLKQNVTNLNQQIASLQQQLAVKEYKIGLSMPLTGELSDVGVQWRTVAEMARDDLNAEMTAFGTKAKFSLVIQDDKTTPTEALAVAQSLFQAGVRVIIGPAASSQVKQIKSFVDDNKVVVMSASSTSPTLAIPNDYIFRTVGSDAVQSKAMAALVNNQGVNKVVVFNRDDEYGMAFADFFKNEFNALGGTAVLVKYASGQADYASEVTQLSSKAQQEGAQGIVIITFDTDGVNILDHAKDDAFLSSLKWFSSEGIHGATGLTTENIAKFIEKTNLLGTRPVFRENQLYKDFAARYRAKAGTNPPVFSANLYDAIFLAGWSIVRAGSYNGELMKNALPKVAEKYYGASGLTTFDTAGDKLLQDYSVWTVQLVQTVYEYVDVGSYSGGVLTLD